MVRVLSFSHPSGGIAHYSYCLNMALQEMGTQVSSLVFDTPAYDLHDLPHSFQVHPRIRWEAGGGRKPVKALRNLCVFQWAARSVDVFHPQWSVGPSFDRMNWRLLQRAGIPLCYTAHDIIPHDRLPEDMEHHRWMHRTADVVFVHGEALKQAIIDFSGIEEDKVHIIPMGNWIPIADFYRSRSPTAARASLGYKEDEFVVLFFGFIRPYKGLSTLIEACKIVRSTSAGKRLRLLIAGASVGNIWESEGYARQVSEANLSEITSAIIEYVPLSEMSRYYLAADVCALPYKSGSQSGPLQLAYAYSTPVVATDVGGFSNVIRDGETGLLVPPDDPQAFAAALETLLTDRAKADAIGKGGREYAERELSWERIARATLKAYESVRRG